MLANGSTVALLAPDARVTWLCHPRPDSAAIFADILGGSRAGYFSVAPGAPGPPARPALPAGDDDRRDPLVGRDGDRLARAGRFRTAMCPARRVGRQVLEDCSTLVRVLSGSGVARLEFAPRPEFGQVLDQAAAARRRPARARLQRADHALRSRRRVGRLRGRRPRHRARRRRPLRGRRAACRSSCGSTRTTSIPIPTRSRIGRRRPSSRRSTGSRGSATRRRHEGGRAQRAHAARPLPRADRLDPGGGDDVAPRGARRRAQLGLPLLLAPRRRDVRARARRPRLARRGRGAARTGSTAASARTGGHPERLHPLYTVEGLELGPEAVIETLPGYAGLAAGARRQCSQPPDPARRLRPDRRSRRRRRGGARLGARRALARSSRRWCRPSSAAGTSPTTASGRHACRRAITSTPR